MVNSWKIGAISGLVAGLIAGIVAVFIVNISTNFGLTYLYFEPPPDVPLTYIALIEITNNILWGILLGIIFARIYDLIPGKGVFKGLLFGLVYYAFLYVRFAVFSYSYGWELIAISAFLYLHPIVYGLAIGVLYRAPTQKLETSKQDKMWGIYSGVFAAILFAICVIIYYIISTILGIIEQPLDIEYLIFQQGTHVVINMFWFAICGLFYAIFHDRIPGKHLMKGFIFGLIFWVMVSGRIGVYSLSYGWIDAALGWGFFSPELFIIWGLFLDAFYNKRGYLHAALISMLLMLIGNIQSIVWIVTPIDYFLLLGVFRNIIIVLVTIILVKISTRSMEKATS